MNITYRFNFRLIVSALALALATFACSDDDDDTSTPPLTAPILQESSAQLGLFSFQINWSQIQGATGYEVDVATDSAFTSLVAPYDKFAVSAVSLTATELEAETTYFVRVRALKGNSTSEFSNAVSVTTLGVAVPTLEEATEIKPNTFAVSWSPILEATAYEVDLATDPDFVSLVAPYTALSLEDTTITFESLMPETTYYARVRTITGDLTSGYSNAVTATTTALNAPTLDEATDIGLTSFTVTWAGVADATSYQVDLALDAGFSNIVVPYDSFSQTDTVITFTELVEATTYYVRVRSELDGLVSASSSSISAMTLTPEPDPFEVIISDFEVGGTGDAALWNGFSQDVTVVSNPAPDATNSSDLVLKMTQTSAFASNAAYTQGPVVDENAVRVRLDVYFEQAGSLKFQIEEDFSTGYFQTVPAVGQWVSMTYELADDVDAMTNYPRLLFQGDTPGSFYIDNVRYFTTDENAGGGGGGDDGTQPLGDFEEGGIGDAALWNGFSQDVSVVSNPAPDAVNSSDQVLQMAQTTGFAAAAVRQEAIVTENATRITFDVYLTVAGSVKLQIESDFNTGQFINIEESQLNQWVTLEYTLSDIVDAETDYPWIVIQSSSTANFYIDNITYYEE